MKAVVLFVWVFDDDPGTIMVSKTSCDVFSTALSAQTQTQTQIYACLVKLPTQLI